MKRYSSIRRRRRFHEEVGLTLQDAERIYKDVVENDFYDEYHLGYKRFLLEDMDYILSYIGYEDSTEDELRHNLHDRFNELYYHSIREDYESDKEYLGDLFYEGFAFVGIVIAESGGDYLYFSNIENFFDYFDKEYRNVDSFPFIEVDGNNSATVYFGRTCIRYDLYFYHLKVDEDDEEQMELLNELDFMIETGRSDATGYHGDSLFLRMEKLGILSDKPEKFKLNTRN